MLIGSPSAINFDGPHPSIRDIWKLEEALASVEADYDLVLIDCAPSLNALTRTAWAASDRVAVVTEPGLFSVAAADRALRAIEEIRRGLSPRLQPLGIIVNRARVQSLEHQFRIKELRDMFGPLVLSPQLPERTSSSRRRARRSPSTSGPGERPGDGAQLRPAARPRHPHRTHRRAGPRRDLGPAGPPDFSGSRSQDAGDARCSRCQGRRRRTLGVGVQRRLRCAGGARHSISTVRLGWHPLLAQHGCRRVRS